MNPLEIFRIALWALLRNKTRSFLTTLGIIIGVCAVIAMVAIGEGAKARVSNIFASMGTNMLVVMPGSRNTGGARGGFGTAPSLTWDDLSAIEKEVTAVKAAAPLLRTSAQLVSEDQNWATSVQGTTPEYFEIRNWSTSSGALLSQSDVDATNKSILLGATVAEKLFGQADAVGQPVRVKNMPFTVVGVLERKGQSGGGQDFDDVAFLPVSTFRSRIEGGLGRYINGIIYIGAISPEATEVAERQVTALLRDRHQLSEFADDDFSIRNFAEMASAGEEGAKTLSALLASIAAVSLLVGGIGIMNIMLVSVTERTREIGIRMAIGARPSDILAQFLIEALTLSLLGGLIGVAAGLFAAGQLASAMGWPLLVRAEVILLAVGFSALVGIVFGLYPARKASLLDPIEALRYE